MDLPQRLGTKTSEIKATELVIKWYNTDGFKMTEGTRIGIYRLRKSNISNA